MMKKALVFSLLFIFPFISFSCARRRIIPVISVEEPFYHPCVEYEEKIDPPFRKWAPLKIALCLMENGEYENALRYLGEDPQIFSPLSDYLFLIYSILIYELGRKEDSLILLREISKEIQLSPLREIFLAFASVIEGELRKTSLSLSQIAEKIDELRPGPLRWYLNYHYILLLKEMGEERERMRGALKKFISSVPPAYYILSLYSYKIAEEEDVVEWVEYAFNNNRFSDIRQIYYELKDSLSNGVHGERFSFIIAVSLFRAGEYKESEKIFKGLKSSSNNEIASGSLFHLARIYYKKGNLPLSLSIFKNVFTLYPSSRYASLSIYKIMQLANEREKIPYLQKIVKEYPDSEISKESLFLLGFYNFYLRRVEEALKAFDKLNSLPNPDQFIRRASHYWVAKIKFLTSKDLQYVKDFLNYDFLDEYYVLARTVILNEDIDFPGLITGYDFIEKNEGSLHERFLILDKLNLKSFLSYEIEWFLSNFNKDEVFQSLLKARIYDQSIRNFWKFFPYPYSISEVTKNPHRLPYLFPRGMSEYVENYSNQYELSSNLIYAVIHQESNFDRNAISYAGAKGLMQLMPFTAESISRLLGIEDSIDFMEPSFNIGIGCRYLKLLLEEFGGSLPLALAGYNGGPQNVKKWIREKKPKEIDEFIELIPFPETKDYVKKVMRKYLLYTIIYGGKIRVSEFKFPPPGINNF